MCSSSGNNPVDSSEQEDALHPVDAAITQVLVSNHRRFHDFLAKRVGQDSVAEDLLQHSLRKALETPPRSQAETSVVAWFYRILRNTLTDHYRSRAREEVGNEEFFQNLATAGEDRTKAPDDLEAAICACMNDLLPTLKPEYAALIDRVDLRGEAIADVAESLGITENNLSVRLHRARQALKTSLERTCGACTEHGCLNCTCG